MTQTLFGVQIVEFKARLAVGGLGDGTRPGIAAFTFASVRERSRCVHECSARRSIGIPTKHDFSMNGGVLNSL